MFKIDLHVHTVLGGDADILPEAVVAGARRVGLDGVCITELHSFDLCRPFERIAAQTGFPIFRGFEYRAAEGHLLVYGVRAGRGDFLPGLPMQQIVEWIQGRGGVAVAAHPYQKPLIGAPLGDRVLQMRGLGAIETLNGSVKPEENRLAEAAATKMGLPGIGGSDAHGLHTLGRAFTLFDEPITSEAHLVQELRAGRFRAAMAAETLDPACGVHSLHH